MGNVYRESGVRRRYEDSLVAHPQLSFTSPRRTTKPTTGKMADSMVYILIFAVFAAILGHARFKFRSLNRGNSIQAFRECQQGKGSSTTREGRSEKTGSHNTLADVLPPSRQSALPDHVRSFAMHYSEHSILNDQVDMCVDPRSRRSRQYTPTGIEIGQIEQLGDFPDYASLSGVPLPKSCREFDIDRALPRPYRPFRWNYHQTMCMWLDTYLSKAH